MIRNIFSLVFVLVYVSKALDVCAYDFESDDIYYTIKNTRQVEVAIPPHESAYSGEVVIPASIVYEGKSYAVTAIARHAFQGCSRLASLTVPASVVEIGDSAFFACSALKYLVLEDGDKPLRVGCNSYQGIAAGEAIFNDCPLETLYLGRELQYEGGFFYGYSPFYKKRHLSLVIIGEGVRRLENRAFYGCEDLTSITLGGRVASIGNYAFYACKSLKELVIKMREKFPDILLMVGNAVTAELVEDLILSGADIVKCGIGSGSACITRRITGVGRPQLSTIFECADTAHGIGGMICSDGGVVYIGDICKAFGAGADFVMMGGFYAGCAEAAGDIIEKKYITNQIDAQTGERIIETKQFKVFYGMSSEYAQNKHYHGMPKYRASEGRVVEVPLRGSIDKMNQDILGGLRSYMTYIGARRLKDVCKCTTFYRVNTQLNTVFGD